MFLKQFFKKEQLPSATDNAFWSDKICGISCLQMAIEALKNKKISIQILLEEALSMNAYDEEKGWLHDKLIKLGGKYGLIGSRKNIGQNISEIYAFLAEGNLTIASVSPEYLNKNDNRKSGHLVLIYKKFFIKDPYIPNREIEMSESDFLSKFSGNIIIFR